MKPKTTINDILDALASQEPGQTSLVFRIEPDLIQEAMNVLKDYRKLFAPVIAGQTDLAPIYEDYERMRQANQSRRSILLLVECQTERQFREALLALPIRHSSEWRFLDQEQNEVAEDR